MGFVKELMQGSSLMGYDAVALGKGTVQVFRRIMRPSSSRVRLFGLLNLHGLSDTWRWRRHDRWIVEIRSPTNTSVTSQKSWVLTHWGRVTQICVF